jgi:hypothetical protein
MRTLLVCTLLMLVPLSSVRMVCFDAHAADAAARPNVGPERDTAAADAEAACERICMRRHDPPAASESTAACVLIPDASCAFLASAGLAVMPREPIVATAQPIRRFDPTPIDDYLPPVLSRLSPPPRG